MCVVGRGAARSAKAARAPSSVALAAPSSPRLPRLQAPAAHAARRSHLSDCGRRRPWRPSGNRRGRGGRRTSWRRVREAPRRQRKAGLRRRRRRSVKATSTPPASTGRKKATARRTTCSRCRWTSASRRPPADRGQGAGVASSGMNVELGLTVRRRRLRHGLDAPAPRPRRRPRRRHLLRCASARRTVQRAGEGGRQGAVRGAQVRGDRSGGLLRRGFRTTSDPLRAARPLRPPCSWSRTLALAGLSTDKPIISFAHSTLAYSILKRVGELFPRPSKATRAPARRRTPARRARRRVQGDQARD